MDNKVFSFSLWVNNNDAEGVVINNSDFFSFDLSFNRFKCLRQKSLDIVLRDQ